MAYQKAFAFHAHNLSQTWWTLDIFLSNWKTKKTVALPQVLFQFFVFIISSLCMHANVAQKFLILTTPAEMIFLCGEMSP